MLIMFVMCTQIINYIRYTNIDNIKVCFHTKYNYDNYNIMSYYYYLIDYAIVHNMIITTIVTNIMTI